MALDRDEARRWSKDRIREEIRERQLEIRDMQEGIEETDRHYASTGYRNAEPGWWRDRYDHIYKLEAEIGFLKSLL